MHRYEDAGLQFADAALAHLAERENIRTVFTTRPPGFLDHPPQAEPRAQADPGGEVTEGSRVQ